MDKLPPNKITKDEVTAWMNMAGKYDILGQDEILLIARKIKSAVPGSDEHKKHVNKLVCHNLRLVVRFVSRYMRYARNDSYGSDCTVDFLQTATIGLRRACEEYDPTRGYMFSTYAGFWIRSYVQRHDIKTRYGVYVPETVQRDAMKLFKGEKVLRRQHQRKLTEEGARELMTNVRNASNIRSLNAPVQMKSNGFSMRLEDTLVSGQHDFIKAGHFSDDYEEWLDKAKLCAAEREIVMRRFLQGQTYQAIADEMDMEASFVRSTLRNAFKKLKKCRPATV